MHADVPTSSRSQFHEAALEQRGCKYLDHLSHQLKKQQNGHQPCCLQCIIPMYPQCIPFSVSHTSSDPEDLTDHNPHRPHPDLGTTHGQGQGQASHAKGHCGHQVPAELGSEENPLFDLMSRVPQNR